MNRPRYLALVFPGGLQAPPLTTARSGMATKGLAMTIDRAGFRLFTSTSQAPGQHGMILGQLFDRDAARTAHPLSNTQWDAIVRSRGAELIVSFWGHYVAFLSSDRGIEVVRSPCGGLGCYLVRHPGLVALASDVDLLVDAGLAARTIAWDSLARHIARPECRSEETCLAQVEALRGGDRLTVSADGAIRETLWTPWAFARSDQQLTDGREAAWRLRNAIRCSVEALVPVGARSVLLLSGGLDSSIVAACLALNGNDVTCLNLIGNDMAADEQRYAWPVAERIGRSLVVRQLGLGRIDVGWSAAERAPYPVARCFNQASDGLALDLAEDLGASMIVDGGGGDHVFFGSYSITLLADCILAGGFGRRFGSTASALGDLSQTRFLTLAAKAMHRAWFRSWAVRDRPHTQFLSERALESVSVAASHFWLRPPAGVWPGRCAHVALLVPAQNIVEVMNDHARRMTLSPLVTQPVIETALRIASWLWIADGQDRAIARAAFQGDLPQDTINRRSKGTPAGFVAELFEQRRSAIRDMLLGGRLGAAGLLNDRTVRAALDDRRPVRDFRFARLLDLVDAEAWARAQD